MQCKYYQILLGRTSEWSLWRGGRFIEVVFRRSIFLFNDLWDVFITFLYKVTLN